MTGKGHALVGVGVGLGLAGFFPAGVPAILAFAGAVSGSTAPDWLELPQRASFWGGQGVRLIPHRTLTHWWPLWVAAILSTVQFLHGAFFAPWLIGFAAGGLSHLLVDLPNPMGIPILTPFAKSRRSLRWWRSGQNEFPIVAVFLFGGYQVYQHASAVLG